MDNKAVIYARVSSTGERQSTARQVADLKRYAAASGMEVVAVYEEKASGAKMDREQLAACRAYLHRENRSGAWNCTAIAKYAILSDLSSP